MKSVVFALSLLFGPAALCAVDATITTALDKLGTSALTGIDPLQKMLPKEFPEKLKTEELDVEETTGLDLGSGREFGAIGYKRLPYSYADIVKYLHTDKTPLQLVSNVDSLRDIHLISEKHTDKEAEMVIKLAINVPVVSDFHTQIKIRTYEDGKGRGIYEWQGTGDEGDLEYVRGAVVVKAHDDKSCDVFVFGAYVIKPDRKVPWVGRGTARGFAKTHYGSYITALEIGLKNRK